MTRPRSAPLHLGVALDGVGTHPGARHLPGATAALLSADRLVQLARTAEHGGFDFVSLDDGFDPPAAGSATLPVRLDALLALARVAPATTSIGLLATITTTHTEPFHVSKNIATLDLVSGGRAGWRVAVSTTTDAAAKFGRKGVQPIGELYAEAEDAIEVASRLWDSWEDDAVIRDRATGRYIDREKLHYVDFHGPFFDVRGPSITPRSPQGQPLVAIDADDPDSTALAARRADIALIEAPDPLTARSRREDIRRHAAAAGRDPDHVSVLASVRVGEPALRRELDRRAADNRAADLRAATDRAGALDLVGEPSSIADGLESWYLAGAVDGFLVLPDALPTTFEWFVADVVPLLRQRGHLRPADGTPTLRDRFGLARPANRYTERPVPA